MGGEGTKRRPMGLKSSMSKKPKHVDSEAVADPSQLVNDHQDEKTATIALKSRQDGTSDDFEDLEEIYNNALEALDSSQEQAILLFQGAIHDCDRIIKLKYSENQQDTLPTIFYYIYGMSLFNLSELLEPSDAIEYLKLASERLNQALTLIVSSTELNPSLLSKINIGIGKVDLSLAKSNPIFMNMESVDATLLKFDSAIQSLLYEIKEKSSTGSDDTRDTDFNPAKSMDQIYSVIDMVLTFSVFADDIQFLLHLINWSKTELSIIKYGKL
ncbi:Enhancer of translation termination 1 [Smittium mucronatum]|uniref:Enhancer of translation termination 1 n=1 Tax=Smittium mucronatum TaxID=133383 RepID=A0A1R0H9J7_9FUNG|nr:Enhancer of translation termination 1 [Smittium mucronatum]